MLKLEIKKEDLEKQEAGERIVKLVQVKLSKRYKYLSLIIFSLTPLYDPMEKAMSTDGKYLFFSPDYLIGQYKDKKNRIRLEKKYMHILFHCLFGHTSGRAGKKERLYDLITDIQVAIAMSELDVKGIRTPPNLMNSLEMKTVQSFMEKKLMGEIYADARLDDKIQKTMSVLEKAVTQDQHTYWNRINPIALQKEEESEASKNAGSGTKKNGNQKSKDEKQSETEYLNSVNESWKAIRRMMFQGSMDGGGNSKLQKLIWGTMSQEEKETYGMSKENRCSYREFLQRFVELQEVIKVDDDEFDYTWYNIGMELYDRMPFLEPLEYKDDRVCDNIVIAIDTSGSCSGNIAKRFLRETCNILRDMETDNRRFCIYLMQCDTEIKEERMVCKQEDFPDFDNMELFGFGGTNFCPVFDRIEQLKEEGIMPKVNGLLYLTDGLGNYPIFPPEYETVFIFPPVEETWFSDDMDYVPSWITKVQLTEDDILEQ